MFKRNKDRVSFIFFLGSIAFLSFGYGVLVSQYHVFPFKLLRLARSGFREITRGNPAIQPAIYPYRPPIYNSGQACEGLNLVISATAEKIFSVKIMDLDGKKIHEWIIDWFRIWPDAKHLPKRMVPRSRPGAMVHGAVVMDNGDLVFNFESLGLVRLDAQGKTVWRLPYRTHHSVHKDDVGNLWACGTREHEEPDARFQGFLPPFREDTILEISPEGKILREWSVPELLVKNGLKGLLYLRPAEKYSSDVLHLNDVNPFPSALKEGFFKKGDVLVSLRNINTVFVFNRESEEVKFIVTGMFIKQHDPNFIDGDTFSLFDNNHLAFKNTGFQSRILIISAPQKAVKVFFEGSPRSPFYSSMLGKHMWLPNGNLLITESTQGRAFEVNPRSEIVWEYINYVGDGKVGFVTEAQRLPLRYRRLFGGSGLSEAKAH